jgi:Tol biopolymer transport system component
MVSTGKGRTTCGYFLADNKHILYASTHEASDACPPAADRSKGYLWAVYPGYDIYLASDDGKIEKKLASAPRYDAEATVNWKTGKIVYTSMASGDIDLWTMNSDGSAKKQITKMEGYDGGAVFSRDGKHLVWRANHPATPETDKKYRELNSFSQTATASTRVRLPITAAPALHPPSRPMAARYCSRRTSTIATAASSSCT